MPKTTKEIGQDYLLFPDENPKYKYNKKWYSEEELRKIIERICLQTGAEITKAHLFIELFGDD